MRLRIIDNRSYYELLVIWKVKGTSVKCWSSKSFLFFKAFLELSFNKVMPPPHHILPGMFKISCQQSKIQLFPWLAYWLAGYVVYLNMQGIHWSASLSWSSAYNFYTWNLSKLTKKMVCFSPGRRLKSDFMGRRITEIIAAGCCYSKYWFQTFFENVSIFYINISHLCLNFIWFWRFFHSIVIFPNMSTYFKIP